MVEGGNPLDLDDSDLPSLRRHSTAEFAFQSFKKTTFTRPTLRRCSLLSHSSNTQPSQPESQSQSQSPPTSIQNPPNPELSLRIIPGPAGAVQSAIQRKRTLTEADSSYFLEAEPIQTQEYIRMAVEDGSGCDEDFCRDPWLRAVDFIRHKVMMVGSDGSAIGMPVSAIKNGLDLDKVNQVVAIIKSCSPNGLGDMMVTLKDPTGTIDASIHRKVLTDGEFGKDISVGAVLILQKVAVFSPSRGRYYLNITLANVIKVISKDSPTTPTQNFASPADNHFSCGVGSPSGLVGVTASAQEQPLMPPKHFYVPKGVTEEIMDSFRKNTEARVDAPISNKGSTISKVNCAIGDTATPETETQLGHETYSNDGSNIMDLEDEATDICDNIRLPAGSCSRRVEVDDKNGGKLVNIGGGSVAQWTDEQLEELFTFD